MAKLTFTGEINFFVEDRQLKDGKTVRRYSTNISHKKPDSEEYDKAYLDLVLSTKAFPVEKTSKLDPNKVYTFNISEGWLDFRKYDQDGKTRVAFYLFANKGKLTGAKAIDQNKRAAYLESRKKPENDSDDDLPF